MTDKQWKKLISECVDLAVKHREVLSRAEAEYERRYGMNPCDIDDDWWIDTTHYGIGSDDISLIIKNAIYHTNKEL